VQKSSFDCRESEKCQESTYAKANKISDQVRNKSDNLDGFASVIQALFPFFLPHFFLPRKNKPCGIKPRFWIISLRSWRSDNSTTLQRTKPHITGPRACPPTSYEASWRFQQATALFEVVF